VTGSTSGAEPHHHWRSLARLVVLNHTIGWCSQPQILNVLTISYETPLERGLAYLIGYTRVLTEQQPIDRNEAERWLLSGGIPPHVNAL
jgi:hypothetical protein